MDKYFSDKFIVLNLIIFRYVDIKNIYRDLYDGTYNKLREKDNFQ